MYGSNINYYARPQSQAVLEPEWKHRLSGSRVLPITIWPTQQIGYNGYFISGKCNWRWWRERRNKAFNLYLVYFYNYILKIHITHF